MGPSEHPNHPTDPLAKTTYIPPQTLYIPQTPIYTPHRGGPYIYHLTPLYIHPPAEALIYTEPQAYLEGATATLTSHLELRRQQLTSRVRRQPLPASTTAGTSPHLTWSASLLRGCDGNPYLLFRAATSAYFPSSYSPFSISISLLCVAALVCTHARVVTKA